MVQRTVSRARADKRKQCLLTSVDQLPSSCLANCLLKDGDFRQGEDDKMESRTMASTMTYSGLECLNLYNISNISKSLTKFNAQ